MSKKKVSKGKPTVAASASRARGDGGPMDVGLLEQIIRLMAANDLNTVDLRDGERRVVLKRGAAFVSSGGLTYAPPPSTPAPMGMPPMHAPAASQGAPPPPADEDAGLVAIKSPMVGTFYTASSPDAKAFVQVGSTVDEDTDVCIIEAMKVFNNIKAETHGTIAKVLVTNGQTVEFGQALFLVKP